jgi:3-phosphoshikimate 1-carboxyvinyltransferase
MRMLSGILAGQNFETELVGDASLSHRPMLRIIEPLSSMGAKITASDGHAPLRIRGGRLQGINYRMPVASAQVKSAVLLAGLFAEGETAVEEPLRTRDHTEIALRAFGATVESARGRVSLTAGQRLSAIQTTVPGDISSAAFFLCAAALFPESDLLIDNVCLNPTRAGLLDVLVALGVKLNVLKVEDRHGELAGSIHVQSGALTGLKLEGPTSAMLIDELPVLAAIAPYTGRGIEIRDARELRVKESDRIAGVAANLRAMGAEMEEFEDGLWVPGNQHLQGAELQSFGDHRIAMAFAVAALGAKGDTLVHGADCARISFPEFFEMLETVAKR